MMKVKIPYALRLKFLSMEGLSSHTEMIEMLDGNYQHNVVAGKTTNQVDLNLSNEPELLKVCIEWHRIIQAYFRYSYKAYRFDIGPYEGLWPIEIGSNGMVRFNVDNVELGKENWKDWFIKEDMEYAPQ